MTDTEHVNFSWRLGDLDNIKRFVTGDRKLRYQYYELFDAGNIGEDDQILSPDHPRAHANRGNRLFHTDSSYNPRRASLSLLRAIELPPRGTGGNTEFCDSRTAYEELPPHLRKVLDDGHNVGCHTFAQSRKLGSPEFFADLDPDTYPMARHSIANPHHPTGRTNLFVGAHLHHIEGLPREESDRVRDELNRFVTQDRYKISLEWDQPGDMICWDNRATLHRAAGGSFEGKHRRDLRRTTVHDDGPGAWGLNHVGEQQPGFSAYAAALGKSKADVQTVTTPSAPIVAARS